MSATAIVISARAARRGGRARTDPARNSRRGDQHGCTEWWPTTASIRRR